MCRQTYDEVHHELRDDSLDDEVITREERSEIQFVQTHSSRVVGNSRPVPKARATKGLRPSDIRRMQKELAALEESEDQVIADSGRSVRRPVNFGKTMAKLVRSFDDTLLDSSKGPAWDRGALALWRAVKSGQRKANSIDAAWLFLELQARLRYRNRIGVGDVIFPDFDTG